MQSELLTVSGLQAEKVGQEQAAAAKVQMESQLAAMMEAQGRLAAECQTQAEELQQARQQAAHAAELEQQVPGPAGLPSPWAKLAQRQGWPSGNADCNPGASTALAAEQYLHLVAPVRLWLPLPNCGRTWPCGRSLAHERCACRRSNTSRLWKLRGLKPRLLGKSWRTSRRSTTSCTARLAPTSSTLTT